MNEKKLGTRFWSVLIIFGLFGQLAWTIENMYFNLFLYNTISGDPNAIAWMVAASATTATLTTIFMGALSDRIAKRKIFITVGYILWGLSTVSFAFISIDNIEKLFPAANAVTVGVIAVIVMDCVMTFFGSTANDASFNAWVTDYTNPSNRGRVEGIIAILPLLAMLIIFGGFDGFVQSGDWPLFFLIIGSLVVVGGIIGFFTIKEVEIEKSNLPYYRSLINGFRPTTIKNNKNLYLFLTSFLLFGVTIQIYMPYFIIYIQRYLGIDAYAILLGVVLLLASLVSVLVSRFISEKNINKFFFPSLIIMILGFILLYLTRSPLMVGISGVVMMSGNLVLSAVISAKIRNYTPKDQAGQFQGVRMIFAVLIPMIIGPFIGATVIKSSEVFYLDMGVLKNVPTPNIFLASAISSLIIGVTIVIALIQEKKEQRK